MTAGTGLAVGAYGPVIEDGVISGCKTGVSFEDTQSGEVGGGSSSSLLEISGCTTGMYLSGSADVPIEDVTIGSIPSGGIGVYTDEEAGGAFTRVSITGGATGFKSYGTGDQTFRQGNITGFTTYGVLVYIASPVDLGDYDFDDPGNNNIYSSSGSAKYVYAKNHLEELGPVLAQANWWGEYPPSSTKFTTATVDYSYALQSEYQMQRRHVAMVELPSVLSLTAGPNPARDRVLVRAEVPAPQASATVEVFDVTGRRVRSLFSGSLDAGRRDLFWDGADDRGAALPAGIYFVRLRADNESRVTRVIRMR